MEKGAKLTLETSVIYGPMEVKGTLSTVSSESGHLHSTINNRLTLKDGAILENATLLSHARYLTDGNLSIADEPAMIITEGTVTVKEKNTITADKGASALKGQNAIEVRGTLHIEKNALLTAQGGGDDANFFMPAGGDAISKGIRKKIIG